MRMGWRIGRGLFRRFAPGVDGAPAFAAIGALAFAPGREGIAATLRRLARRARARRRLVLAVAAATTLAGAIVCLFSPPRYTATAVVVVSGDGNAAAAPASVESLASFAQQTALLDGRVLAAEVIRTLGLEHDARFTTALDAPGLARRTAGRLLRLVFRKPAASDDGDGEEVDDAGESTVAADVPPALIRGYRSALAIRPVRRTGRVEVDFTSPSPALAQQIANAHATAYVRRSLQARFAPSGAARALLEHEADRTRDEHASAAAALAAFRDTHPGFGLDAKSGEIVARLTDLARRVGEAQAARISAQADEQLVRERAYDALPAVAADPLIKSLRADVERLRARHAGPGDGGGRDVTAELRQARSRLDRELRRALAGIESSFLDAQGREAGLRAQLDREQAALPSGAVGEYMRLQLAATATEALDAKLGARVAGGATVAGARADASRLEPAALPRRPSEPRVGRLLVLAIVFGGALGVLVALVLEREPRALRTPDDVRRLLRVPTLAVLPDFARVARAGAAREAYRTLRTSILFTNPERPPRTLLVTSCHAGEGKTATTVNLGFSLAALGMRVAIVDGVLGNPGVHRAVEAPGVPGLADLLAGEATLEKCLRAVPVAGSGKLAVIATGRSTAPPAELFASPRTRSLLAALVDRFDVVLIDSPAVLPATGPGPLLAPLVDGVLLVVPAGGVEPAAVADALARLRATKSRVVGVVLNRVDPALRYYRTYAYPFAA